ncbi:MAG: FAD-dependent oxidoreductase [SAR324 cluster bacterium]|nr:FAD-dependent oxidoreductase [SAR324 cluster bacterium]
MSRILILGAGVSGHTAAQFAKRKLGSKHEVIVVSPNANWNWIPSNVWVGVGLMTKKQVTFPLKPVYDKMGITFIQAKAQTIYPEGSKGNPSPFVVVEHTEDGHQGKKEEVHFDYLINATGPKLNFGATPGLGPEGHTESICTADHAIDASEKFMNLVEEMKAGQEKRFLVGTGHGMCTCQGAAFEYLFNLDFELRKHGVREKADLHYISNEANLGDFGVGGMHIKRGGYKTHSKVFTESLFSEQKINWTTGAHVAKVESGKIEYEDLQGDKDERSFDFAMLIPPFGGVGLTAVGPEGEDWTTRLFAPNGFMKVDAIYEAKPYKEWSGADWPKTYQNPTWSNLFAVGIAFAPPHFISQPRVNPNGIPINPTPPRTGMPSAMIGKAVALSIADMIKGATAPTHHASMAEIGAACVASAGNSLTKGRAAAMTMFPVVPDYEKYPETGRDLNYSFGEVGLGAHWIKFLLHYLFIYKAKGKAFWYMIPE